MPQKPRTRWALGFAKTQGPGLRPGGHWLQKNHGPGGPKLTEGIWMPKKLRRWALGCFRKLKDQALGLGEPKARQSLLLA